VYATNQPQDSLPLEKAILAYREEYLVERRACKEITPRTSR